MRSVFPKILKITLASVLIAFAPAAQAFEGRIRCELTRGPERTTLNYVIGSNTMRIAITGAEHPHPIDIVNLQTGALTLLFPHNRSFVRLPADAQRAVAGGPGARAMPGRPPMPALPPGMPPGVGPQSPSRLPIPVPPPGLQLPQPPGGSLPGAGLPGAAGMGPSPMVPAGPAMMFPATAELKATGEKKDILGFPCVRYELAQRGEMIEIWATEKLLPYRPYVRNQPPRFALPQRIEDIWPTLLLERRLFPMIVSLRMEGGAERFRFELKSIKEEPVPDADGKLFQAPPDYTEVAPRL